MATFKELMSGIKSLLKEKLNETNLELFSEVDKKLDELSESHTKTEEDLSTTKDKLVEVVKNTSFKDDSEPGSPEDKTKDPMDVDSALESAIKETIANRK